MAAQFIRILPESQREPSALAGQSLDFVLPNAGLLQANSVRLEFGLSVGKGNNSFTATVEGDNVRMSPYAGAWSLIKNITISSDQRGTLSQLRNVGRTMATLYSARYSDGTLEMTSRRGGLELCTHSIQAAVRILVSTSGNQGGPAANYAAAAVQSVRCALDLSFGGLGLLGQDLPLDLLGGLRITVQFAQINEALYSPAAVAGMGYFINEAALSGSVYFGAPNKSAKLVWNEIESLRSQIDTGRKTLTFNSVPASSAIGFLMSVVPAANLNNPQGDEYDLSIPSQINEMSYQVAGYNAPLSYNIQPLDPLQAGEDYSEILDVACSLFGGQICRYGSALMAPAMTVKNSQIPTWWLSGARFAAPVNMFTSPLAINIASATAANAPLAAYVHVIGVNSLAL